MTDPIIAEIRKSRAALADQAGNDLKRFAEIIADEERLLENTGKYRFVSELRIVPADSLNDAGPSSIPQHRNKTT